MSRLAVFCSLFSLYINVIALGTEQQSASRHFPSRDNHKAIDKSFSQNDQESFALAMYIRVAAGETELLSRFMNAVYHPQNVFLVEISSSADLDAARTALSPIATNVYLRVAEPTVPDGISEVLNFLSAMAFFVDREDAQKGKFKYFINTSVREYPVLTASNMRSILSKVHAHDSPPVNFMKFSEYSEWPKYSSRYERLYYDSSIVFTRNQTALKALIPTMSMHPDSRSRKFTVARSQPLMLLSSSFVRFATDSLLSKRILMLLADSKKPLEHFFATLAFEAKSTVGKWVTTTSLRCPDVVLALESSESTSEISANVRGIVDPFLNANASRSAASPVPSQSCLFAGPVLERSGDQLDLRDAIDSKLLSVQGDIMSPSASRFSSTVRDLLINDVVKVLDMAENSKWAELENLRPIPL